MNPILNLHESTWNKIFKACLMEGILWGKSLCACVFKPRSGCFVAFSPYTSLSPPLFSITPNPSPPTNTHALLLPVLPWLIFNKRPLLSFPPSLLTLLLSISLSAVSLSGGTVEALMGPRGMWGWAFAVRCCLWGPCACARFMSALVR